MLVVWYLALGDEGRWIVAWCVRAQQRRWLLEWAPEWLVYILKHMHRTAIYYLLELTNSRRDSLSRVLKAPDVKASNTDMY